MDPKLRYDGRVKASNQATRTVFAAVVLTLLCATAEAQIHGAPPSVTSLGFGGHAISGVSPSVTSLGPRGYTPGFNPAFPNSRPVFGGGTGTHHHHHFNSYSPLGATVYAVPVYGYGYYDAPEEADNVAPEEQYNGGPTIFDRRGPGTPYRDPISSAERSNEPVAEASERSVPDPAPTDQPETVLVFKDGHQAEVVNYAIVGDTLFDLTGGRKRKIALSDLDLGATAKANDDRGIDFQVPPGM